MITPRLRRPTIATVVAAAFVVLIGTLGESPHVTVAAAASWAQPTHFFVPPITFSADRRYLALGGSAGPAADFCAQATCPGWLHVWDLRIGQRVFVNDTKFARVMSLVFSQDGRHLISGHSDGTVLVWSVGELRVVSQFHCCAGTWIRALVLSPDERTLAIGGQNGDIVLWSIADDMARDSSVRVSRLLGRHYFGVSSLVFDARGEYLISSADDQHVRRWSLKSGASSEFHRAPGKDKAHRGMVKTVVLLNGGTQALSGAYWEGGTTKDYDGVAPPDHILRLWDVATGQPLRSYPLFWGIRCCIHVLDGQSRVTFLKAQSWNEELVLQVFNLDTGLVERQLAPTMGESFHAMAVDPTQKLVVIAIGDGQYLLWNLQADKPFAQLVSVDEGWAVVAADGRMDFSEGFRRWPCRHNVQSACDGGATLSPTNGLLPALFATP